MSGAVIIFGPAETGGLTGGGKGLDQRVPIAAKLRAERPRAAAIVVAAAFPSFLLLEIGERMASGLLGSPEPRDTDSEILEELRRLYSGIASPKALP